VQYVLVPRRPLREMRWQQALSLARRLSSAPAAGCPWKLNRSKHPAPLAMNALTSWRRSYCAPGAPACGIEGGDGSRGETLDLNVLEGLLPTDLTSRAELNKWEQQNIETALIWLRDQRRPRPLDEVWLKELNRQRSAQRSRSAAGQKFGIGGYLSFRLLNLDVRPPSHHLWSELRHSPSTQHPCELASQLQKT
jgi:hypothetical protein